MPKFRLLNILILLSLFLAACGAPAGTAEPAQPTEPVTTEPAEAPATEAPSRLRRPRLPKPRRLIRSENMKNRSS